MIPDSDIEGRDLSNHSEQSREYFIQKRIRDNELKGEIIDLFEKNINNKYNNLCAEFLDGYWHNFSGVDKQRIRNIFEKYCAVVLKFRNLIESKFQQSYPGKKLELTAVSAERTLPGDEVLNSYVDLNKKSNSFQDLMISQIRRDWSENCQLDLEKSGSGLTVSLLDKVNKALSDNLFIDNAYHLAVE